MTDIKTKAMEKITGVVAPGVIHKMEKAITKGDGTVVFILLILISLTNDFLDYLVIGSIPILGDVVDLITSVILTAVLWDIGGFIKWKVRIAIWIGTALELFPGGDIVPTYTLSTIYAWHKIKQLAEAGELGISQASEEGGLSPDIAEKFKESLV